MSSLTYAKFDIARTLRNRRFLIFSLAFPLVLLLVVGGSNKDVADFGGISFVVYYLAGMISWGAMMAVLSGGARIAPERQIGWVRQLRLTPLSSTTYVASKVASGYVLALLSMVILSIVGVVVLGVSLPAGGWARMVILILIGLIPFAAMGIWLGHTITVDAMGPALGGLSALFALLGGAWGPLTGDSGLLHDVTELLPSYWLVQAGHSAYTGMWWPAKGWIVVAVWTVAAAFLARRAYARDGARV